MKAWLSPEDILGSPPLNLSKAAEIRAELKNTIIKLAPKIKIANGIIEPCSSGLSEKAIPPVEYIIPNKTITKIAAIIGKKTSSLSFFNTFTHDFIR